MIISKKLLDLIACTFVLIIVTFVSSQELRYQSYFSNLRSAALFVDRGEFLESYAWNAALSEASLLVKFNNCDSVNIDSGLRVLLKDLDRSIMERTALKESQYRIVKDYFSHALKCKPTDGNIWIRYALVENAFSKKLENVASMAALSNMLSPSDKRVTFARSELVRNSSESLKLLLSSE